MLTYVKISMGASPLQTGRKVTELTRPLIVQRSVHALTLVFRFWNLFIYFLVLFLVTSFVM